MFLVISIAPALSYADEDVTYWDDHHQVRQEKGKDIGLYVDALFKRVRGARTYRERWDAYVAIQKEIPEELILKEGIDVIPSAILVIPRPKAEESLLSQESACLMAWKEMKELLLRAQSDESRKEAYEFLHTVLGSKPSEEPFRKFWEKAMEDNEFSQYDGFEFSWLVAPYLPTKTGGLWVEKMGDAFVEQGNFLRAYAHYQAIKDHSMAYDERIEKKLGMVKEGLGRRLHDIEKASALEGLKLTDGTIFRLVIEERGMHQEKIPYLEISLKGFQENSRVVRKRIYDYNFPDEMSKKYGLLLIRNEDKILLVPQIGKTFLVFDLNGMLLEKKPLTKGIAYRYKEIASRYKIESIDEFLFSEEEFVHIPKGIFQMGFSPNEKKERKRYGWKGGALHTVRLTKDFYLQNTEVTQLRWYFVMGETPSHFKEKKYCEEDWDEVLEICPNHPVEQVSLKDIQIFIQRLNEMQTKYVYRLPTEAEWEYAARVSGVGDVERRKFLTADGLLDIRESGLANTKYGFGNSEDCLDQYAWYHNSHDQTHSVLDTGIKPIGGLYNMYGNVWECVSDRYDDNYGLTADQLKKIVEDPQCPVSSDEFLIIRGGGWASCYRDMTSANRNQGSTGGHFGIGFRLVRIPEAQGKQ